MSRIVCVWLRAWPILRLLRARACALPADAGIDTGRPLVLVAPGKGGKRIVASNRAARDSGLRIGELLSNARSKVLDLDVEDADPAADRAALHKIALWAMRYAPVVSVWDEAAGGDGLFIDIAGAAHLRGGEERLLEDLEARLRAFGLYPRLAIAGTAGAAWALAHHGRRDRIVVPPGGEREALAALPLAGLRLSAEALASLRRLGFRRIGELIDQPRAPFATRFEAGYLMRLDQALGRAPEPLIPVVPPPAYRAQRQFLEPIFSQEHVLVAATRLLEALMDHLERDGVGARVLRLLLFKVDGETVSLDLGLAAPSREVRHIAELIGLRLYRLAAELETDFGFEAAAVHVLTAEAMPERQNPLAIAEEATPPQELARLVDRLRQRLGAGAVRQLLPSESHIPERAVRRVEGFSLAGDGAHAPSVPPASVSSRRAARSGRAPPARPWEAAEADILAPRPLLLLPHPEAADVVALIPDGPPRQFRWRGALHQVVEASGPERIAPEWWRRRDGTTRDYYLVEDTAGRRFWLFRAGLYDREASLPRWFVHGLFG